MAVQGRVWRHGRETTDSVDLASLSGYLNDPATVVWLDVCDPTGPDLASLMDHLSLDPHAVEDALARRERAKASRHQGHTFLNVYTTRLNGVSDEPYASRLRLDRLSAFVLPNLLLTVRRNDDFDMSQVVDRWEDNTDLIAAAGTHGVGALLHGLLDVVVDGHFETIQTMDDAIESLEDLLFDQATQTATIQRQVYRLRKELVELRRVVLPMREIVNTVLRHRAELNSSRELDGWYDDLYDHVLRAGEWTESLRDMVTTLFETNLSLQDAHLNTVMKKLAGWAAIIAVPTAVTGWFGQNVPYPGFSSAVGFWQSLVLIVLCSVTLYAVFRRRDWL